MNTLFIIILNIIYIFFFIIIIIIMRFIYNIRKGRITSITHLTPLLNHKSKRTKSPGWKNIRVTPKNTH